MSCAAEHQLGEYRRRIAEATRIPRSIRSAVLTRLEHYGVSPDALEREFLTREGYLARHGYRAVEYIDRIAELYGSEQAERMLARVNELADRDDETVEAPAGGLGAAYLFSFKENFPRYAVVAGPDAEFLKCLGCAMGMIGRRHAEAGSGRGYFAIQQVAARIDELFAKRGIPYRFDDTALVWAADSGLQRVLVDSALDGLADPRLAGARSEFEAAVGHLRAGGQKELEDAIEQAATSVDSALKVLAGQSGTHVAANATVQTLFDALTTAGHVPRYTANLIHAAARIRNNAGAHRAGSPQPIELDGHRYSHRERSRDRARPPRRPPAVGTPSRRRPSPGPRRDRRNGLAGEDPAPASQFGQRAAAPHLARLDAEALMCLDTVVSVDAARGTDRPPPELRVALRVGDAPPPLAERIRRLADEELRCPGRRRWRSRAA